ncbi:MAG: 16S rRNA (uracil(1498)-N(3))-methyltransferase [Flavobacteriaceae bacterium]|nr:16S rRNA (uracil(1498)-N(3))-methyltransferase [Flavobacteriaceae bacterium]
MQLFYSPHINLSTNQFTFDKIESRHIVKVLRKTEGDILHITNGKGILFQVQIEIASDKKCLVNIISKKEKTKPWSYYLHVAIAPTKNNDRLEWFLEKATELGIDEITPIICDHSERKIIKKERLEKVVVSSMKQSLKHHLPKLNDAIPFSKFIQNEHEGDLFIAHCEEFKKESLKSQLYVNQKLTILIGPEGDFSTKEIALALNQKYKAVSLGESRLRTETAALVSVHSLVFFNEK